MKTQENDFNNGIMLIRIPKNATRSMAKSIGLALPGGHKSAKLLCESRSVDFTTAYKIACVRNPYSRLVSWHKFHSRNHPDTMLYSGYGIDGFRKWVADEMPHNFWMCDESMNPFSQKNWIMVDGKVCCKVIHYEKLQESWESIKNRFGVGELEHINKTEETEWREWYDEKTAQAVTEIVLDDLLFFGYDALL